MPDTEITRIDSTTYEFLKGKLSSDIGTDVKNSLFRQYWVWLAGFTAGIALLGIVSFAKLIPDFVQSTSERLIQNRLGPLIKSAEDSITSLNVLVTQGRRDVETTVAQTRINADQLKDSIANMRRYSEDAEQDLRVLRSRIVDNKKSVEDVRTELITSIKKDLVTVPDLEAVSNRIADVVKELLQLKEDMRKLREGGAAPAAQTPQEAARVETLQKIVSTTAERDRQINPARSATVFIQFALLPRDTVRTFAGGLKELGWTVPPEDQEDKAIGLKEIRYFYEEDAPKVAQLITDVDAQISRAGYSRVGLAARPLLNFPRKPKPGTLEVWIGVVPPKQP